MRLILVSRDRPSAQPHVPGYQLRGTGHSVLEQEAEGSGSGQQGEGSGISRTPEGTPAVLTGLGVILALAKACNEPPGVSMPPDAMWGLGSRGQLRGCPEFPGEEDGTSTENSRSHRPCRLREKLETCVSRADAYWQVPGCGSKWHAGTEVSGLKQGGERTVRMLWLLATPKGMLEPAHCGGLGPGEVAGGPGWSELQIEKPLWPGVETDTPSGVAPPLDLSLDECAERAVHTPHLPAHHTPLHMAAAQCGKLQTYGKADTLVPGHSSLRALGGFHGLPWEQHFQRHMSPKSPRTTGLHFWTVSLHWPTHGYHEGPCIPVMVLDLGPHPGALLASPVPPRLEAPTLFAGMSSLSALPPVLQLHRAGREPECFPPGDSG
ncbi:hypothetical protein MC885_019125 [Smutsia gigantea]|nr:hypothetical protein MC885_019125 [Smutsia gigantea]